MKENEYDKQALTFISLRANTLALVVLLFSYALFAAKTLPNFQAPGKLEMELAYNLMVPLKFMFIFEQVAAYYRLKVCLCPNVNLLLYCFRRILKRTRRARFCQSIL